ncbi:MAG: hypothetical protein WBG74_16725, partial [Shewanella sp.]|uniref:hypothetical protein n=1 Tax=Shewanella sp. TaxID=50422 RepID=UPI003C7555F1
KKRADINEISCSAPPPPHNNSRLIFGMFTPEKTDKMGLGVVRLALKISAYDKDPQPCSASKS